ncbi:MAG: DoxX family protein [Chitinophagaceae bacterium]|nr:DoxX family protein [Chitinophagaceae bacterium]
MNLFKNNFILRFAVAVILLAHSIPGMFDGGINNFGKYYLNETGFSPIGVPIAWAIKLSHIAAAICLLIGHFIKPASMITILVLIMGIIMVHFKEGWYVVGGGRNGIEFNFLLIFVLLSFIFPNGFAKNVTA